MDRIKFSNKIVTDCIRNTGEQHHNYYFVQWKTKGKLDIFNHISDHVTLDQLIDTAVNVNNASSITKCWIYD